ncbi:MAG: hypothetical protein HQ522_06125 [Bacteroidetes bacterium]|nr:hypothetical protein [Bacteroidota bacterium]
MNIINSEHIKKEYFLNFNRLLFLFFVSISLIGQAQNSEHFFKSMPVLKGNEPTWVSMMYSKNPNVF